MKIEDILKTSAPLPLSKRAIVSLMYTGYQINSKLSDALKPFEVSIQQFNVLRILRGQHKNPVSLAIIQERMIAKMSNTTRLIDKLVVKGLVEKNVNKSNRRKVDIVITNKGLSLLKQLDIVIDEAEKNIISPLDEKETTELNRLLGKIRLIAN